MLGENSPGRGEHRQSGGDTFQHLPSAVCVSGVMEGMWASLGSGVVGLRSWFCHLLAVRPGLGESLSHVASVSSSAKRGFYLLCRVVEVIRDLTCRAPSMGPDTYQMPKNSSPCWNLRAFSLPTSGSLSSYPPPPGRVTQAPWVAPPTAAVQAATSAGQRMACVSRAPCPASGCIWCPTSGRQWDATYSTRAAAPD